MLEGLVLEGLVLEGLVLEGLVLGALVPESARGADSCSARSTCGTASRRKRTRRAGLTDRARNLPHIASIVIRGSLALRLLGPYSPVLTEHGARVS